MKRIVTASILTAAAIMLLPVTRQVDVTSSVNQLSLRQGPPMPPLPPGGRH